MLLKIIILLFILSLYLNAKDIKLYFKNNSITNAQTALLILEGKGFLEPKVTFLDKKNINFNFFKNPFDENQYYSLIPVSYYKAAKNYKIIVSYIKNEKKVFKSIKLRVKKGTYKSEAINVKPSIFKPPKQRVQRTKEEYTQAMRIYNSVSKKIHWESKFIYPMNTKITSPFGTKRLYNGQLKSFHTGTDFRAKVGTPIYASNSGIVKISSNRFYSGNSIVIDHGQGIFSCYFHLNKMDFKVGDFIKRGEIIGLSGATGRITGPHLHFSFRINGTQVDPLQAIKVLNNL
jgi:murein DD-endopeptidase MepM/ murein hydrolase activator NlpD